MTAPQGPTSPTTSALVDGQSADAADVLTPFNELAAAVDEARQTLAVDATDAVLKYLGEALTAGSGISLSVDTDGGTGSKTIRITASSVETGTMQPWFGSPAAIPAGYLLCDGSLASMSTYKDLLDLFIAGTGYYGATVKAQFGLDSGTTVTAANALNLFTATGHGLNDGDVIMFSNSGGALPAGLDDNTAYYVTSSTANDFQVSLTAGGSAVDITDDGTGTHSFHTQYKTPDMRGRAFAGLDQMLSGSAANRVTDSSADSLGGAMGEETHTLTVAEMPEHAHYPIGGYSTGGTYNTIAIANNVSILSNNRNVLNDVAGGDGAHNNMQPTLFGQWIIKV